MDLSKLKKHIETNNKVIIAIDGPSASGKSTLALKLQAEYDALLIKTDDYFLHPDRKTVERLSEPGGNLDRERLYAEVFQHLSDEAITSNHFNCFTNVLETSRPQKNKDVIIVEGAYSLHPLFQEYYTFKIFMDIDKKTQINRIKERNGEKMLQRWITEWIPLEDTYFSEFGIKRQCDLVLKTS